MTICCPSDTGGPRPQIFVASKERGRTMFEGFYSIEAFSSEKDIKKLPRFLPNFREKDYDGKRISETRVSIFNF